MRFYKKIYENSIDDFFDKESEEEPYYEGSYDIDFNKMISEWLDANCYIEGNYIINDDNIIDIDGDILISNKELEEFPEYIQFNKVEGSFFMNNMDKIKSLRGCPRIVNDLFQCSFCTSLQSLNYCPKKVKGFIAMYCDSLESLEGGPIIVEKGYNVTGCKNLKSLKGAPKYVGGDFFCFDCVSLESLEGGPEKIEGTFSCHGNKKLRSLLGAPVYVGGNFKCYDCINLKSYEGKPEYIGKKFIYE